MRILKETLEGDSNGQIFVVGPTGKCLVYLDGLWNAEGGFHTFQDNSFKFGVEMNVPSPTVNSWQRLSDPPITRWGVATSDSRWVNVGDFTYTALPEHCLLRTYWEGDAEDITGFTLSYTVLLDDLPED